MGGEPTSKLPEPLDRIELGAVGRKKYQSEHATVLGEHGFERTGMVVPGVVEHDHHALAAGPMAQELPEEVLEALGVEPGRDLVHELAASHVDRTETGHGLSRWGVQQHRIADLRGHPQAARGAVLLEVAFVHAPQVYP